MLDSGRSFRDNCPCRIGGFVVSYWCGSGIQHGDIGGWMRGYVVSWGGIWPLRLRCAAQECMELT